MDRAKREKIKGRYTMEVIIETDLSSPNYRAIIGFVVLDNLRQTTAMIARKHEWKILVAVFNLPKKVSRWARYRERNCRMYCRDNTRNFIHEELKSMPVKSKTSFDGIDIEKVADDVFLSSPSAVWSGKEGLTELVNLLSEKE